MMGFINNYGNKYSRQGTEEIKIFKFEFFERLFNTKANII